MREKVPLCLDGRMLHARATGVATYARTVRSALARVGVAPLILDDATRGRFGEDGGGRWRRWLRVRHGAAVRLAREPGGFFAHDVFALAQARFARTGEVLRLRAPGPPGIVHWTYPVAAAIEGWSNLYTIHDVIPLTHPELAAADGDALRRRLDALLPHAGGIVTVSEHSRGEIVRALRVDPGRVVNAGLAVDAADANGALPAGLVPDGYFLFHGAAEPRKNLPRIIAAWQTSGAARPLVIAGPPDPSPVDLGGAIRLPYLPRDALMALIGSARALVFPSLAEGFGLPVAEAMSLGVPVLTSADGALAETAGGAALLVAPERIDAIAEAIRRLDREDELCARLRVSGLARAGAAFGIDAFGRRLLAAYAELAGVEVVGDPAPAA